MSALSSVSIPRPQDWAAFERASVELWRYVLNDHGIQRYGKSGQAQYGLDFFGYRNKNAKEQIGVQCKCFATGKTLEESLVRTETAKAIAHFPGMTEYFIITTVDDSTVFADLCDTLTREYAAKGRNILIRIWGWSTLEQEIQKYPDAHKAFDPNYTPYVHALFEQFKGELVGTKDNIIAAVTAVLSQSVVAPGNSATIVSADFADADKAHNSELDRYRSLMSLGKAPTALSLILDKENALPTDASVAIRSRLKALAGHCKRMMGDIAGAVLLLQAAYDLAPDDARGQAAKVAALALSGRYQEAFEYGLSLLKEDPENESAMTWMAFAAAEIDSPQDLDSLVPAPLQSKESFAEAKVQYLRAQNVTPDWWIAARNGAADFPANTLLKCSAADSELDELLATRTDETGTLSVKWRNRLIAAGDVLRAELQKVYSSEVPTRSDSSGVALNASAIFAALRRLDIARDVLVEALDHHPENIEIATRLAQVAANLGDVTTQNRAFDLIPNEGASLHAKIQILDFQHKWQEIVDLVDKYGLPPRTKGSFLPTEILVQCARIRVRPKRKAEQALRKLIENYSGPPSDLVVAATLAKQLDFPHLADLAYEKAKASIDENSHIVERVNVAIAAAPRGDLETVADVLIGHVDTTSDSTELHLLARALGNIVPVTTDALNFFETLPKALRDNEPYDRFEANARFNAGDTEASLGIAKRIFERDPTDLTILLLEAFALGRLGREAEIIDLFARIKVADLDGLPLQKMQLTHLFRKYNRERDAVELGYRLVLENPNDPKLVLKYVGLFFGNGAPDINIETPSAVADRTWVKVESDSGKIETFLIDSSLPHNIKDVLHPGDDRVASFLGRAVDDAVKIDLPFNGKAIWTVREIKSPYLSVLHDIIQNFNSRFPAQRGFQTFSVRDDDPEGLLTLLQQMAPTGPTIEDEYATTPLPVAIFASARGINAIKLLERLETADLGIRTCVGTTDEREEALGYIARGLGEPIVLDVTAAWTILSLDAWDVFADLCGDIAIPASVLDEIVEFRQEIEAYLVSSAGTISYPGGRAFFRLTNTELAQDTLAQIDGRIGRLKQHTQILPSIVPTEHQLHARQLCNLVQDSHVFDAIFISLSTNRLLLTEDKALGSLAKGMFGCASSWLQAAFSVAAELGLIDHSRYATLCAGLAVRGHGFVAFDAATLFELSQANAQLFKAACDCIGKGDADLISHLNVVRAFIDLIYAKGPPPLRAMAAMSTLLECFVRVKGTQPSTPIAVLIATARTTMIRDFLEKWALGHFMLPTQEEWTVAQQYARLERENALWKGTLTQSLLASVSPKGFL